MVSEAEFDANQKKFRAMRTAGPSPTTGGPSMTSNPVIDSSGNLISGSLPGQQGIPLNPFAQQVEIGTPFGNVPFNPSLGLAGGPAGSLGASGGIGAAGQLLKSRLVAGILGATVFAFIAGGRGLGETTIGKLWNQFASDNNLDIGKLRLAAFEQMFTTPIEDPTTGEWTYLFSDETELSKRMRDAGVDKDQIPGRIVQLWQTRQANTEAINAAGPIQNLQQIPGETALQTAQRVAKENFEARAVPRGAFGQLTGNVAARSMQEINQENIEEKSHFLNESFKTPQELKPGAARKRQQFLEEETTQPASAIKVDESGKVAPATIKKEQGQSKFERPTPEQQTFTPFGAPPGAGPGDPSMVWDPVLRRWVKR